MEESVHEEHLSQPQTNIEQFKIAVTLLTGYIGFFTVSNKNNNFCFAKSNTDKDGFIQITIPPGAYEIKNLNNKIKRNIFDEEYFTETNYPFTIKPKFLTPGSIMEISREEPLIFFLPVDSIRNFLGFFATTIYVEYKPSPNLVNILSFDNFSLGCDIAQGMIFKSK